MLHMLEVIIIYCRYGGDFSGKEVGIYDLTASWENYYIQSIQMHRAPIPSPIIHVL